MMKDYLRRRFPLADTSTVYMSGKSVYNLVRYNKPGIIGPVELLPGDAEAFREAVREARADDWDAAVNDAFRHSIENPHWTPGDIRDRNPHREEESQ